MSNNNNDKSGSKKSEARPIKAKPKGPNNVQFKTNFELLRQSTPEKAGNKDERSDQKKSNKES